MITFKKSLAMFLAIIMMFSSLSFSVLAYAESNECTYYVETYFMDTQGNYSDFPDLTVEYKAVAGTTIELYIEAYEGFTFDAEKSNSVFEAQADNSSVGKLYYQRNKYKFTYVYEDLLGAQTEESNVYFGALLPGFEANPSGKPVKQGYNFIMWSLDENERIEIPEKMPSCDINVYPIYEIKTFTYTFDAGEGGYFSNGEQILTYDYTYGDVPEIPEEPVMPNFEFVDWDADIPSSVTSNIDFAAMYNEVTYFAVFMNGDEEIAFMDGYYYGDIIEEIDIPEGYEAWTLSDGTYAQFPYTVEGDTVFYAASAPEEHTARFYLDVADTEPYATFTALQGSAIEYPDDPQKVGYDFVSWTSDIAVMPDEDIDFIAEWAPKEYTITFDTDGGTSIEPISAFYDSVVETPVIPTKDGYVFAGWEPEIPEKMPAEDITVTAKWEKTVSEDYLGFKTEIYTYDETLNDWVVADKVERGEKVKARVYIETGFAVSDGQVLLFFNNDAFSCDYNGTPDLVVNQSPTSTTGQNYLKGSYTSPSKNHSTFTELVLNGYISKEFLDTHTPVTFTFSFSDYLFRKISGDEWFAEFELTAKDDAVGKGDFFVVPETICNSEEGYYAYISFSRGTEGESWLDGDYDSLFDWNASSSVESRPVSTGYGRLNLDAGMGTFKSTESNYVTYDFAEGETVAGYEDPVLEGFVFGGFEPEIPEIMTADVYNAEALWIPYEHTPFKIIVNYTDFSNGEAVETSQFFDFTGTTGHTVEIVETIPENPDENTHYYLIEGFTFDFNELDDSDANIMSAVIEPDGSTELVICFKPVNYTVMFNANGGKFEDGTVVKAFDVPHGEYAVNVLPATTPYKTGYVFEGWSNLDETTGIEGDVVFDAMWIPKTYTLTIIDDGEETVHTYAYGALIDSIVPPDKEGHEFIGWIDDEGVDYTSLPETMPDYDLVFIAVFRVLQYNVTFDYGYDKITESFEYGDLIEAPENPEKPGYTFMGWYDENDNPVRDFGVMPAKELVYTARFEPNKYTVTFYYDDTLSEPYYMITDDCDAEYLIPENPEKSGYKFVQWIDAETNAPVSFDSSMTDKIPVSGAEYYAEWSAKSYDVVFDAYEGEFSDGTNQMVVEYKFDETVYAPDDPPVRAGYEFIGWADAEGSIYYPGDEIGLMQIDGIIFTAIWNKIIDYYRVSFETVGDIPDGFVLPESYYAAEGETVVLPPVYSIEGYEFDGWYYNGNLYAPDDEFEMPSNDIVLTCVWTKIPEETTVPVVTEPTTTKPVVTEPSTTKPAETTKPSTTKPAETTKPTTTKPVVTEPTTTNPVVTEPTTTNPVVTEPTTTKPVVTEPTTTKPVETTKPTTTNPVVTEPTTTKPVVTEPTTTKPVETTKPTTTKPVATEPTTTKPVVTEPSTTKPVETTKPTTTKPVATEPTTTKPVVTEPSTTKPVETTKPTTTKPVATEPSTTEPGTQVEKIKVSIKKPSTTTISYGDSIILHAEIEGSLPADSKIVWTADNGNFKIVSTSVDGMNCTVTPDKNGDTVFTMTVVDKNGNELGSDTQNMTSKAGFFQKIIAFFKKLFGMTKIIPEIFKPVFEK